MPRYFTNNLSEGHNLFVLLRALAGLLAMLIVLIALLYSAYLEFTDLAPEDVEHGEHELSVDSTGRKIHFGDSWLERRGRIWSLHLYGNYASMGAAHGHLAGRLFRELDHSIYQNLSTRFGDGLEAWAEKTRIRWDYRGSDQLWDHSTRQELAALAQGMPIPESRAFSSYHQLALYQNLFDLGMRGQDVLVEGTMFAVSPKSRKSNVASTGNLVIGRNFAVDLGTEVDVDRLVTFYHPDGKYPFVSVAWAGMVGVITGINARSIFVAANMARSDIPRNEYGRPLPLILREIMEQSDTLEQAVQVLRTAEVRTAGIVLVGDGVRRQAEIVEIAPRGYERRLTRGKEENIVWATDHMLREPFERDAENDRVRRTTSSGYRYDRIQELLQGVQELTPPQAAEILRDRSGLGHRELGLGNRSSIENLRNVHSVIVDATSMVLWVSEGPSALGRFRAFDLRYHLARKGERSAPPPDIEADRLLHSEQYYDYQEALDHISYARQLLDQGRLTQALASARTALALAPDIGELHRLLGDIERERHDFPKAKEYYLRYLDLNPGRYRERERVLGLIEELESEISNQSAEPKSELEN